MNPRSDEELKARRQARRSERGQRLILMFGALLTVAALGVGAAAVLEARTLPRGAGNVASGVVTIAASSFDVPPTGITPPATDARWKLQADVVLDASMGGAPGEISLQRTAGTDVAVLSLAKKAGPRKGLREARELVRKAGEEADLVVVVFERKPSGKGKTVGAEGTRHARFAHGLVDSGADLVLARGRASVGGLEWYKGRLIVYDLGTLAGDGDDITTGAGGITGVLQVTLTPAGSWIDGRVFPMGDDGAADARTDGDEDAFSVLRAQSRALFGASAVWVERSGFLRPPTSEHT